MNDIGTIMILMVIFVVGACVGFGIDQQYNTMWRDAVQRGLAEYCPADDSFAWKGECTEK